ncbi:Uncharacterised protein [Salmonella enterica subsp. arizonae]|uniref:Uncharacterized protein n=1 Tax=Salmonella enterica subsp. arizonae TaxID=59203 RepID=A0A2X4THF7_SALER|nr:Uncharacterised protein [Salmonella enterica subsp. arizonae]
MTVTPAQKRGDNGKNEATREEGHQAKNRPDAQPNLYPWSTCILYLHQMLIDARRMNQQV